MKHPLALLLSATTCLVSCTSTINLPLDNAKLSDGYINSGSLDFGHVLAWDTKDNVVRRIYRINPSMVPSAAVDSGPRYSSKASSVSRDTKVEFSATPSVPEAIKGEATAQFISATDVTLTNYNPREYRDARYLLNSPELRQWRTSLGEEYADPRFRFILISRVTDGDVIQIKRSSSGNVGADANIVEAGQFKFKVTYANKSEARIEAKQAPMTVSPSVFSFRIQGDSFRFYSDLNSNFNLQTVKQS